MATTPVLTFNPGTDILVPAFSDARGADTNSVVLGVSLTLAQGQVLAQNSSDHKYYAYNTSKIAAGLAPVPTEGGAGALGAGVYTVGYTAVNANGETILSATAAATLGASKLLHIAALPLPTGAASFNWYISRAAGSTDLGFAVNTTDGAAFDINALPAAGALDPPAANTAYVKTDGTQLPKRAILQYAVMTDSAGMVTLVDSNGAATGDPITGAKQSTAAAYYRGEFRTQDLTGLDANALAVLKGALIMGDLTSGVVIF